MKRKKRHFRGVLMLLECGCEHVEATDRWRLTQDLAAIVFGRCVRRGVWCNKHKGTCHPTEFRGTTRI